MQKYTNALIHEKSPYLLQHAHNQLIGIRGKKKPLKKPGMKISLYLYQLDIALVIGAT